MKKRYGVIALILGVLLGTAGTFVGMIFFSNNGDSADGESNIQERLLDQIMSQQTNIEDNLGDMTKVLEAYTLIQDMYVEDVEDKQLIEGAIQGMLLSLEDPYSVYLDQEAMEEFNQQIESSFEGIGAEVSMVNGNVTIVSPIKDSPAEKVGLSPNDQVLTVDGESLEGLSLQEAVNKIRGEKGSEVTLEIRRPGVDEPLQVNIVRDSIPVETVYVDTVEQNGKKIGIIELTSFSETTAEEMKEELEKMENDGIEGLVIDVRGNPGGLLPAAEGILEQFIPKDKPILQMEDENGKKTRYFSNLSDPKDYPVAVLINEGSASASEILAISLKEALDYEIVGETTFGKGTVQQTLPMGDGSTIKLTRYKWLSSDGTFIDGKGVEPTVEQKMPEYYYTHPIQIEEDQVFAFNETNPQIKNIQTMLDGLGYDVGRTDGYYNKETEEAVKEFQEEHDLSVSGEIDKTTAEVIETQIRERIREGEDDLQKEKAIEILTK
ncbi:carboxyl-terminal processing protease [Gracilibacillus halotolerans]|uniref:Carboxyl-terminal processing protease n=1 Tax=Gracilibacillus halotolerans TaxID=74386 RepID=A0A841RK12_9BACI|nr:S41 family peptidase [Gracilibacillus halotolerans]MBB6512312.1 carboxyl-terminal processing protease [Gracilibacillus halotolerans]